MIPDAALDQHVAILGKTGSGKTYTAKGAVERLLEQGRRVCIIDPTGAWWGLRAAADGKEAGFPVAVFGGDHADVPIAEASAAPLAELIAGTNTPCIIDLSDFLLGARHRFMEAFAEALYRHNRSPLHLVVDEADEFAPQSPLPETRRMLGMIDRIIRRGRIRGFRAILIAQRPAVLHKNVLTQANTLVAMRLTSPQDRKAIEEWIKGQADLEAGRAIIDSLPRLERGQGWVWAPELDVLEKVAFDPIRTFDSSRTPEEGDLPPDAVELAPVDLSEIRDSFAAHEEDARANDPAALKARVAELEQALAEARAGTHTEEDVERARAEGRVEGYRNACADAKKAIDDFLLDDLSEATAAGRGSVPFEPQRVPPPSGPPPKPPPPADVRSHRTTEPAEGLTGPQQRVIDALAWLDVVGLRTPSRIQVAFVAGYKPGTGTFNNLCGQLRTAGLVDYPTGGTVTLLDAGWAVANKPSAPGTTPDLHRMVLDKLNGPQRRVLSALLSRYPQALDRETLADSSGYKHGTGTFNNILGQLRSLGLADYPTPGQVRAEDLLFIG